MNAATLDAVRRSRREVGDGALRILRVADIAFGEAKRAAATVEYLEIHLGVGATSLLASLDRGGLVAEPVEVVAEGGRTWRIDAAGASGMVLAARVADLLRLHAGPEPIVIRLTGLGEPSALEAAMLSAAASGLAVAGQWPTGTPVPTVAGDRHDLVVALPARSAPNGSAGPGIARATLPGPSGIAAAADAAREPTPAELHPVAPHGRGHAPAPAPAGGDAVLIAWAGGEVGGEVGGLDPGTLADAGFEVTSHEDLVARTEQATRHGLRMPPALWHRFEREAKRWLVSDA